MRARRIPLVAILVAFVTIAAPTPSIAQRPAPTSGPAPIEVRARADRTAAWIGDRVTYVVELRCAPGVDVVVDDLAREAARVEGGELAGVEAEREEVGGRVTHRVRFTLVTYRVDVTEMLMQAMPVRYAMHAAGAAMAAEAASSGAAPSGASASSGAASPGSASSSAARSDSAPAGQVMVPPLRIAIRSAIPETSGELATRAPAALRTAPRWLRFAEPVGLGLILLGIIPVLIGSLDVARRARTVVASYRASRSRKRQRGSFDQIRALDPASDAARVEAFGQLDTFVKDHVQSTTGLDAHALTPVEIQRVLEQRRPPLPHEAIGSVLAACERARYDAVIPTATEWDDAVRTSEQALGATGR